VTELRKESGNFSFQLFSSATGAALEDTEERAALEEAVLLFFPPFKALLLFFLYAGGGVRVRGQVRPVVLFFPFPPLALSPLYLLSRLQGGGENPPLRLPLLLHHPGNADRQQASFSFFSEAFPPLEDKEVE